MLLFDPDKIELGSIILVPFLKTGIDSHGSFYYSGIYHGEFYYYVSCKYHLDIRDWKLLSSVENFNSYCNTLFRGFFLHKFISIDIDTISELSPQFVSNCLFASSNGTILAITTTSLAIKILSKSFSNKRVFIIEPLSIISLSGTKYNYTGQNLQKFKNINWENLSWMYQLMQILKNNRFGYDKLYTELQLGFDKYYYIRTCIHNCFDTNIDIRNYILELVWKIML